MHNDGAARTHGEDDSGSILVPYFEHGAEERDAANRQLQGSVSGDQYLVLKQACGER
jgi:hypothetical protein